MAQAALLTSFLVAAVGCMPTGAPAAHDQGASGEMPATGAEPLAEVRPARAPLQRPATGPMLVHNLNMTLVVDDPVASLAEARELILAAGGEINHASGQPTSATINGSVPSAAHPDVRNALAKLAREIQSENTSSSDMGREVDRLQRRLHLLALADSQLTRLMQTAGDPERLDALAVQRELNQRERTNLENQIRGYSDQVRKSTVYVSFTPPREQ